CQCVCGCVCLFWALPRTPGQVQLLVREDVDGSIVEHLYLFYSTEGEEIHTKFMEFVRYIVRLRAAAGDDNALATLRRESGPSSRPTSSSGSGIKNKVCEEGRVGEERSTGVMGMVGRLTV